MRVLSSLVAALIAITSVFHPLSADPGDVTAAARGVVRVVLIAQEGDELVPITHGSGFAVSPTRIVTNAHVLREALADPSLRIGVVPSQGEQSAYARIVAVSVRNDLALIEITASPLRLPPLALAGGPDDSASGEVVAVGYPMNVDLAQGLGIGDIFRAQPPVKSRGFLSGERPSRQFDTILHTAPIGRGNSGGPLLDGCGRVIGVNSFSADGGGGAEFFFAVSLRELVPFLRAQGVEAQVNTLPCRSIAELNAAERARQEAEQAAVRERLAAREAERRAARESVLLNAQMDVIAARETHLAGALLLLLASLGAGYTARTLNQSGGPRGQIVTASMGAALALFGAGALWITRPGVAAIEDRIAERLAAATKTPAATTGPAASPSTEGQLICTLLPERSRVTSARTDDVPLTWRDDGCVNARSQYGRTNQGEWSRAFVPATEDVVAVNTYDPATRTLRIDRYLLGAAEMASARAARQQYVAPSCGTNDAARTLGEQQSALLDQLPDAPNERLVYRCAAQS